MNVDPPKIEPRTIDLILSFVSMTGCDIVSKQIILSRLSKPPTQQEFFDACAELKLSMTDIMKYCKKVEVNNPNASN